MRQKSSLLAKPRFLAPVFLGLALFAVLAVPPYLRSFSLPYVKASGPSLTGHILAGSFADGQRDIYAAVKFYEVAYDFNPDDEAILEKLFGLYLSSGDVKKAVGLASKLLAVQPDLPQARLVLAIEKFRQKKYADAESHMLQTGDDPFSVFVRHMVLMWAAFAQGGDESARTHANALLDLKTLENLAGWNVARLHEALEDMEEAERLFETVAAKNEMRAGSFLSDYIGFLVSRGRSAEALLLLESHFPRKDGTPYILDAYRRVETPADRPRPTPAEGLAMGLTELGVLFSGELPAELTLPYLHQALRLNPASDKARVVIGELLTESGNEEAALVFYDEVSSGSASGTFAVLAKARILENIDRKAEARSLLTDLAAAQDHAYILQSLADFYRRDEQMAEAEKIYTELIRAADPDDASNWELFFYRGITLEQQGRWAEAERDLLHARRLSGDQPFVLNYLGYSWVDNGINLHQGLEMIKKAVAQEPRNGFFVDSLGWAFYRMKDFEKAVQFLEKATELEPDDPEIIDHLGDALWQSGRKIEARYQWRRALAIEEDSEKRERIEDKIDHGVLMDAAGPGPAI